MRIPCSFSLVRSLNGQNEAGVAHHRRCIDLYHVRAIIFGRVMISTKKTAAGLMRHALSTTFIGTFTVQELRWLPATHLIGV